MKKTYIAMGIALLLLVGAVSAYGWGRQAAGQNEDAQGILETGTYQDLVQYRQDTGFNVMPMVQDEEDFNLMQERHEAMEQYMDGEGNQYRQGFSRGFGGRMGGCPYMN